MTANLAVEEEYEGPKHSYGRSESVALTSIAATAALVFLLLTTSTALVRPLWNDELFTFYIATLPTFADTWSALMTGSEQIPILYYCIIRAIIWAFGASPLSIRLVSIIGFMAACVSIFVFLSNRVPREYAVIGALLPIFSPFYRFSYEARPYALVLGLSAIALCCWQHVRAGHNRVAALIGLFLALTFAIGSHYYAILVVFPLLIGELLRAVLLRSVDAGVFTAVLAAPVVASAASYPLMVSAAGNVGDFWANAEWRDVIQFYVAVLVRAASVLGLAAAFSVLLSPVFGSPRKPIINPLSQRRLLAALPPCEWGGVLGFALLPVLGLGFALVTGAFVDRYMISAVIGLSIALTVLICTLFRRRGTEALLMASTMIGAEVVVGAHGFWKAHSFERNLQASISAMQSSGDKRLPVVASETHTFLELAHYAPSEIASRLIYLADVPNAARLLGHSSVERGMVSLVGPWFAKNVADYNEFISYNCAFFVIGSTAAWQSWIVRKLQEEGKIIERKQHLKDQDKVLLLVSSNDPIRCSDSR